MPRDRNFECHDCGLVFAWSVNRDQHCKITSHRAPMFECDRCDRFFSSESARQQHMKSKNHFKYECHVCDETWPSETGRKAHEIDDHYYCHSHDRFFQNWNNIQMHLKSRAHLPANGGITCPFCKASFTTATGLTHHIERGSCPNASEVNRSVLYKFVRSTDTGGVISKKLIGWHGSEDYDFEASASTWNGHAYECYLCHRDFTKLHGLTAHLNSPYHQQALYHCPKCQKDFTILGGLINHLESETCGCMRFEKVQSTVDNLMRRDRLLT